MTYPDSDPTESLMDPQQAPPEVIVGADEVGEVDLVDHQQVRRGDPRPTLAGDLVAAGDVDHEDLDIHEASAEDGRQIVATRLDDRQVDATVELLELFDGVDLLVSDCLRREPHPTHANLAMALELIEACRAKRGVLSHLDKSLDYATLSAELPSHVLVAFDGMELTA